MKEIKHFINTGETVNSKGIYPLDISNPPLKSITNNQTGVSNRNNEVYSPDPDPNSISDCIGRLVHFVELLNEGDVATVAEWRGMICSVFFQGLISGRHELVTKYVNVDNNNSALCNIIYDRFLKNGDQTGYNKFDSNGMPVIRKFEFYKKDNTAFAMVVPGVVLMPFANYNRNIFSGSNWVRANTCEWDINTINMYFRGNVSQAEKFIQYLEDLRKVSGTYAKAPLANFIRDICANMPQNFVAPTAQVTSDVEVVTVLEEERFAKDGIFEGQFFEKKLLCFKPYGEEIENGVGLANFKNAWDNYRIDHEGELLTPIKVYEFCKERDDLPVYAVPPINKEFLDAVTSGEVEFISWNARILTTSRDKSAIEVSINIKIGGKPLPPVTNVYFKQDIFVAEDLPYITMWPFVKPDPGTPEWKEYYVGVLNRKNGKNAMERPAFTEIDKKLNENSVDPMKAVAIEDINVTVYGDSRAFDITTDPFGFGEKDPNGKFSLMKTTEFPEYVMLTCGEMTVGCWQINKGLARNLGSVQGRQGVIGFDFATTSTVEALFVNDDIQFIEGPGAYLYDVFNPLWEKEENSTLKPVWEMIQTYYFFGCKSDRCEKIYSYGQKNIAVSDDKPYNNNSNYVTGRSVLVSPDYIQQIVKKDNKALNNASIYTPIKWPDGPNASAVRVAAENFILNCLTWGLLAARIEKCESVKINVSYPLGDGSALVNNTMQQQIQNLSDISGYGANLTFDSFSEAAANTKYLVDGKNYKWHDIPIPNPENGFMLVDIGGGTTDISVCQYSDVQLPFEEKMKCETSFNYAGRELIDISLLKIRDFKDLWASSGKKGSIDQFKLESILKGFGYDETFAPENKKLASFKRVVSFVGFLLDQAVISDAFAGPHIADRMNNIKYKFLALSWVLGRYVRHLHDEQIITVNEARNFKIYLTGCAAKGINTFCVLNDAGFMAKCRDAASYGYYNNKITKDSKAFIEIEVLSGERKQEVAFGLTQLESNSVTRGGNNGGAPALGGLVGFDDDELDPLDDVKSTRVELRELDQDAAKDYFKKIVQVVNRLETSHPSYDEVMQAHGGEIYNYIENPNFKSVISPWLCDKYIFEELYALYTFENYRDTMA